MIGCGLMGAVLTKRKALELSVPRAFRFWGAVGNTIYSVVFQRIT